MSRGVDSDFEALRVFIQKYSISAIAEKSNQLAIVKSAHKGYLPFLQFWAICADKAANGGLRIFGQDIDENSREFAHLRESVSDIGSGFFCCLHGAYKPAHMALRSSIENFLRFAASAFDAAALETSSIFELFNIAKNTTPFGSDRSRYVRTLRSSYVELCKYSHSVSLDHMVGINALEHFPSFDERVFRGWQKHAKDCMTSMATVTTYGCPSLYVGAHFRAQEMLDELIPQSVRLTLLKRR